MDTARSVFQSHRLDSFRPHIRLFPRPFVRLSCRHSTVPPLGRPPDGTEGDGRGKEATRWRTDGWTACLFPLSALFPSAPRVSLPSLNSPPSSVPSALRPTSSPHSLRFPPGVTNDGRSEEREEGWAKREKGWGEDMRGNKWWIVDVRLTRIQLCDGSLGSGWHQIILVPVTASSVRYSLRFAPCLSSLPFPFHLVWAAHSSRPSLGAQTGMERRWKTCHFLRLVHIPFIPSLSISFLSPLARSTSLETDERDMERYYRDRY